ncbi:hypothetical protein M422DRAFT_242478 [Sphaerobolus stellatus SS14]|nr:hypothetical protein M422DRAFT_242478 [Sphaerobolus stellatus SS14]
MTECDATLDATLTQSTEGSSTTTPTTAQPEGAACGTPNQPDPASTEVVRQCLAVVERQQKGKIDTGKAGVLFFDIIPASEEGDRVLQEYLCMCAEVDRESAATVAKGKQPSTTGQAAEAHELNKHSNNEDETKTEKTKRSFDEIGLPWFGKPDPILNPRIRKTLKRKQYYLMDPKQVKQSRLSLIQSIMDIDITVCSNGSTGRSAKQVQSVADWMLAFYSAKAAVHFFYEELNTYEEFIMRQFSVTRTSEHRCIIELDKAIRKQAISFNNCTFSTVPNFNGLIAQYLNTIGLRPSNSYVTPPTGPSSNKQC